MHLTSMYPDIPAHPPVNIHHCLFNRPDQQGWKDHTFHIDGLTGERRTFRQFKQRVVDGATALSADVGVDLTGPNEIVGILGENCLDYFTLIQALLYIATPFTMLSHFYTPFELTHALDLSTCTRIFVQPKFLSLIRDTGFPADRIYLLDGAASGKRSLGDMIDAVRARDTPRTAVRPAGKDTLAYLMFSSGTSGLPKAVMISHGNLWFTTLQGAVTGRDSQPADLSHTHEGIPSALVFLPLHHAYAFVVFNFRALLIPITLTVLPKWDLPTALALIPKYKITILNLIPSIVHQIVHSPLAASADLSSLRSVSSGAAYLPAELGERIHALAGGGKVSMTEGYGMSEFTMSATTKPIHGSLGGRAKNIPGSAGILLPGVSARLTRPDGSLCSVGEPGELWIAGGGIALGYWNNPEATKETFVDGWLRTGDRFKVDSAEDGVLFFQDRAKDTLKVGGMQVSPTEIENALIAHPDKLVLDAAVAGVVLPGGRIADEKVPRAWVVLSAAGKAKGEGAVVKALDAWIGTALSKYKRLRGGIAVVSEIPKSPTGKVLRRVLQDEYEQQTQKPSARL
ncbi:acetyl-CoA synthetase-like protein [Athelia psychrophila]|uniref:Acetyl-CoA synthetase-like protein n=1 Tax=Athelia psychrophila TaxID=1759441 RepID=A0A166LU81_9AGAM|nr:acetyl-CoA synthetase-like protein [Fibularhizoctonia sp. CBS 109695]